MHQERFQNKGPKQMPIHPSKDIASSAAASARQSVKVPRSEPRAKAGSEQGSLVVVHKSTGPRTAAGKQRSGRNALKHGIFSKEILVKGESGAEFDSLLRGLRKDLQPQGTLETLLVDNLAVDFWRKRRLLLAENAEIENVAFFQFIDLIQAQHQEVWDRAREGETAGGMLRPSSNRFVDHEAIQLLTFFRDRIQKCGFQEGEEPWLLKKLYGFDHNGEVPYGLFDEYKTFWKQSEESRDGNENPGPSDEPRRKMIQALNREIKRLKNRKSQQITLDDMTQEYRLNATQVPPPAAMDHLVRYEAHLIRDIHRILNELERLQRMRRGQPAPPTLNVNVS